METRKIREKEFHNILRDKRLKSSDNFDFFKNKKWYSIVQKSKHCSEKWLIKHCSNKRVLDYCCGNGGVSFRIAKMGAAEVVGIDISDISIENAKKQAEKEGLSEQVKFLVMDAENMEFMDNYFDVIYESGVLHHLDLQKAYSEIARILKPDGQCLCIEALGHNPIINMYRRITPHLRTEWEISHILKKKDIAKAKTYFNKVEVLGFFHLTTITAVPLRNSLIFNTILKILETADRMLLKLPIIRWQAWQVVFSLSEPKK